MRKRKRYVVLVKDSQGKVYEHNSYRWKFIAKRKVRSYGSFSIAFDDVTGKYI